LLEKPRVQPEQSHGNRLCCLVAEVLLDFFSQCYPRGGVALLESDYGSLAGLLSDSFGERTYAWMIVPSSAIDEMDCKSEFMWRWAVIGSPLRNVG